MKQFFVRSLLGGLFVAAIPAMGCSHVVRYRTATHFTTPPGGKITYYATYMEGNCGGYFGGCSNTNSKIRRCAVNDDNTLTCVDDAEGNKALDKENQN